MNKEKLLKITIPIFFMLSITLNLFQFTMLRQAKKLETEIKVDNIMLKSNLKYEKNQSYRACQFGHNITVWVLLFDNEFKIEEYRELVEKNNKKYRKMANKIYERCVSIFPSGDE